MHYEIVDTKNGDTVVYRSRPGTDLWKVIERCGRMNFIEGGRQWRTIRNGGAFVRRERIFASRYDILTRDTDTP